MTDEYLEGITKRIGERRLVNVCEPKFDALVQVKFREKPLADLTREELLAALDQALGEVYELRRRLGDI